MILSSKRIDEWITVRGKHIPVLNGETKSSAIKNALGKQNKLINTQKSASEKIGRYGKGNIDLTKRPIVKNKDGSISTIRSMSFSDGKKEILIPTVVNGKIVSDEEAIKHYYATGEYLGKFDTIEEADEYAEKLHEQQERLYANNKPKKKSLLRRLLEKKYKKE